VCRTTLKQLIFVPGLPASWKIKRTILAMTRK
jgi:hypothetical protein